MASDRRRLRQRLHVGEEPQPTPGTEVTPRVDPRPSQSHGAPDLGGGVTRHTPGRQVHVLRPSHGSQGGETAADRCPSRVGRHAQWFRYNADAGFVRHPALQQRITVRGWCERRTPALRYGTPTAGSRKGKPTIPRAYAGSANPSVIAKGWQSALWTCPDRSSGRRRLLCSGLLGSRDFPIPHDPDRDVASRGSERVNNGNRQEKLYLALSLTEGIGVLITLPLSMLAASIHSGSAFVNSAIWRR